MRKIYSLILTVALALGSGTAMAQPDGIRAVDSDAVWFVHADLTALRQTTLGQRWLEEMEKEEVQNKMEAIRTVFNFDPGVDLHALTLYGYGGEHDGVVVARGRFDQDRLDTLVKANDSHESSEYSGHTVHSWIDEKKEHRKGRTYGASHGPGTLVFADSEKRITHALDILDGDESGLDPRSKFPGLRQVDAMGILVAAADMKGIGDTNPKARALQAADSAALSIGETGGNVFATLVLEVSDTDVAQNLKRVVDGLLALAVLNQGQEPFAARLAETAGVDLEEGRIRLSISAPVEEMLEHMENKR